MRKMLLLLFFLLLLLLPACALMPAEEVLPQKPIIQQIEAEEIKTVNVVRGDLINEKDFFCKYQPVNEESLSFAEDGPVISAVYVKTGDTVEAGDLIAELDNTQLHKKIDTQQQAVASLNLQISQQQSYITLQEERIALLTELAVLDSSYQSRLSSAKQMLSGQNEQLVYLFARLSVEKATLEELLEDLEGRQLFAGIDGTVSYALSLSDSKASSKHQTVCTIQDLRAAAFIGSFPAGHFEVGQQVSLRVNDQPRDVVVESIITAENQESDTVRFQLVTPDTTLKTGDTGVITLVTASLEDVLYLTNRVIHRQNGICYVYYQDEKGLTAAKAIEVGDVINGYAHIISGLKEGEPVISTS